MASKQQQHGEAARRRRARASDLRLARLARSSSDVENRGKNETKLGSFFLTSKPGPNGPRHFSHDLLQQCRRGIGTKAAATRAPVSTARRRTTMSSGGTYRPPTLQTNESNTNTAPNPPDLLSDSPIMPTGTTAPAPPPAGSPHSTTSGSPRQRYHAVSNESESSEDSNHGAASNARAANNAEEDTGMSLTELLYGTSSYHAIAKPGEFCFWLCRIMLVTP